MFNYVTSLYVENRLMAIELLNLDAMPMWQILALCAVEE